MTSELCNVLIGGMAQDDAKDVFVKYASHTLQGLIEVEEQRTKRPSSLRVWCRMDISVMKGPDGKYQYFVSEVERSQTVGLYRGSCSVEAFGAVTSAVACIFPTLEPYIS